MVKEVKTDDDLKETLATYQGKLVVIDFFATWCGPCVRISPVIEELSKQFTDAIFLKIDVDGEDVQDSVQKYQVNCMPTFVFLKNGVEVDRLEGANEEEITMKITKHM